ncbi:glycosyltransferase family 61 protein [Methylobacterium currus]|uniref:glycosyltransferase family 61 protein n=1 Tax=Methylobacterium currus TaxID=2051553 RepID=UPI001E2CA6E7|nr:glycosyltransferase 61 family protein [Methylobacterium currus]UHC15236.1 glycosyltransferase family 61 protein [Methylobacterium currus]
METNNIRDIRPIADLAEAVRTGGGYVRHAPPELPDHAHPLIRYEGMVNGDWFEYVNRRRHEIPSVGCQLVSGGMVFGAGHALAEDKLVVEGSNLDTVEKEWAGREIALIPDRAKKSVLGHGIVATGPGHLIYGHWIVDFLPRLYVAKLTLGQIFSECSLILPNNTPEWALNLCRQLISSDLPFEFYDPGREVVVCEKLWLPTYPLSSDHHFHSSVRQLYQPLRSNARGDRKILISRAKIEGRTAGATKCFLQRKEFEEQAVRLGYDVIYPEELSFEEQVRVVNSASVLAGEFGSGLHSSVFGSDDLIVAAAGCFNAIQSRLCTLYRQRNAYLIPDHEKQEGGPIVFGSNPTAIARFFDAVESALHGL